MALLGKPYADKVLRGQVKDFGGGNFDVSLEPLTFTGAVEAVYDGKSALTVEIPTSAEITEADKEEIVREVTNTVKTEVKQEVVTEVKTEVVQEVVKEENITVITEEVLKQLPEYPEQESFISGKWSMTTPEHLSESVVPAMVQEVNFESEVSLYSDNTFLPSDTNAVVSTHKVICKAIEIFYMEAPGHKYTVIFYHVESTDAEFMELIQTADGKNQVIAYGFDKWNSDAAKMVDFGTVQNVSAAFKEAFEAMAVKSETLATLTNAEGVEF